MRNCYLAFIKVQSQEGLNPTWYSLMKTSGRKRITSLRKILPQHKTFTKNQKVITSTIWGCVFNAEELLNMKGRFTDDSVILYSFQLSEKRIQHLTNMIIALVGEENFFNNFETLLKEQETCGFSVSIDDSKKFKVVGTSISEISFLKNVSFMTLFTKL